jgi:hypothetical protein
LAGCCAFEAVAGKDLDSGVDEAGAGSVGII